MPIAKRKGAEVVGEHRRIITLMPPAYKNYVTILANRLRKEIEKKKIVLESQAGFREGRRVVNNLYVINFVVERQLEKEGKVIAAFIDLKAVFDLMDRERQDVKEVGISKRLRERIMEKYEETRSVIRIGESYGKRF